LLVVLSLVLPGRSELEGRGGSPSVSTQLPLFATLAGVLLLYLGLRYQVLGTLFHRDAAPYIVTLPASLRLSTAVANVTEFVRLFLFPVDLAADYGPGVILPTGIGALRFWVGGGIIVAVGIVAVSSLRRSPWIAFGILWLALSLAVVGNVLFPVGVWIAERTLYLPSVGISLLAVGLGQHAVGFLRESPPRPRAMIRAGAATLAATLLVILGGARTWTRNATWHDTEAVFMTLAQEHPEAFRAQWWMGMRLIDAGEPTQGLEWLKQAVDINPNELRLQLDFVRGLLLAGRSEEALVTVSDLPLADPARDVYLTQSHIQLGRPDLALEAVQGGLSRFPDDARLMRQARELGVAPALNP